MADINLSPADDVYAQSVDGRNEYNQIFGLGGNDRISLYQGNAYGGIGNDTIERLTYPNELWRSVVAHYGEAPTGVQVNLAEGWANDGWGTRDTLIGINDTSGSNRDDTLTGNANDNRFWPNNGNDSVIGGAGIDGVLLPWFKPAGETNNRQTLLSDLSVQVSVDGQTAVLQPRDGTGYSYTLSGVEYFEAATEIGGPGQRYYFADFITQPDMAQQAIAAGDAFRWNTGRPMGSAVTVSFSFVGSAPASGVGAAGFRAFTPAEQQAVRDILAKTSALAGINFSEVAESGATVGQLRFGVSQQAASKGVSWLPGQAGAGDLAGDVWMDVESMVGLAPGSEGFAALLHEIGHALGLRHGRNVDAGDSWAMQLRPQDDVSPLTVMTGTASADGLFRADWGPLDVGALRYLYGTRGVAGGDSSYTLGGTAIAQTSIVDDGGIDTLDASASASPVSIELKPGGLSSAGLTTAGIAGVNDISIYTTSVIENAVGSRFDDVLNGNDANNRLTGGLGNDLIDGGKGQDTAGFAGKFTDYTVTTAFGKVYVEARDGSSGYDTLLNIESLAFADRTVSVAVAVLGKTASADLDGDGRSDIVLRNGASGINALWKGGDAGSSAFLTTLGNLDWTLAGTADFDGDRKADLLWRNAVTGQTVVWKGGDSAASLTLTSLTDRTWGIAGVGDFDGDGKADVLWRNAGSGINVVWKGGDSAQNMTLGTQDAATWAVAGIGDFNADGKSDILWRNASSGANVTWLGGSNAQTATLATVSDNGWKIAGVGDFDGDGQSDILWRHEGNGGNVIWKSGDFAQRYNVSAISDSGWAVVGTGDYSGDGRADILWRHAVTGANALWLDVWGDSTLGADNPYKGGSAASHTTLAALADMSWKVTNQTSGAAVQPPAPPAIPKFVANDFDGDGKSDILWRHTANGSDAYWKVGASVQGVNLATVGDLSWNIVATGDIDGDGKTDIVWRNAGSGVNVVWKGGDSAQNLTLATVGDTNWKVVGAADFNGDGKADLLWRNAASGQQAYWKGGAADQAVNLTALGDPNWKIAALADLDGDGKTDLVWRNSANGQVVAWKGGDAAQGLSLATVGDGNWFIAGSGDFDGDGKADLLWRNGATGVNAVWKAGDPNQGLSLATVGDLRWNIAGVGDYDGDGKADVLWRNGGSGELAVWIGGDATKTLSLPTVGDTNWKVVQAGSGGTSVAPFSATGDEAVFDFSHILQAGVGVGVGVGAGAMSAASGGAETAAPWVQDLAASAGAEGPSSDVAAAAIGPALPADWTTQESSPELHAAWLPWGSDFHLA